MQTNIYEYQTKTDESHPSIQRLQPSVYEYRTKTRFRTKHVRETNEEKYTERMKNSVQQWQSYNKTEAKITKSEWKQDSAKNNNK